MSLVFRFQICDLVQQNRIYLSDLHSLKIWLKDTDLPNYTDEFLALFLMACNNDLERTKRCAYHYYWSRKEAPELFNDRNVNRSDIQHQLQALDFCIMPERTDEGYVVVLHRLSNYDPSQYHMDVAMKVLIMTMDTTLYDNPPTGFVVLFDMKGVGMMHLTRVKIMAVKKFFHYIQEGLPLQLRAVHVLNAVWFFDKILKLLKPFYKPELLELLHTYRSDFDMEQFYKSCIPRKCLPSDYGGELQSVEELNEINEKTMQDLSIFYKEEELFRS